MITMKLNIMMLLMMVLHNTNLLNADQENKLGIIGGNKTTIEKHPWIVSIQSEGYHNCGGSIINENTIITAAHCFDSTEEVQILAGTADLTQKGEIIKVQRVINHENFNLSNGVSDDIAIYKLSSNLTFSDKIKPIALPENKDIADGTPVIVSGWGYTNQDRPDVSNDLLDVELYIVNPEICYEEMGDQLTDNMICAGFESGFKGSCNGDSGGPLELNNTLVGIVSWGGEECAGPESPNVFTKVVNYISWIKEHINI
ncbi:unnamed protein product [Phyllotreta striolata]|uniref:Peptidase S1 domain-containing protein n=1 Tax=Phyllotreta striolata TaxID=444603 RepID=A0A9N9TQ92_PHYSR|nr:unnamed protein product [Phyllotreta striolata]